MNPAPTSSHAFWKGILLLVIIWLLCAWGARSEFLPYDVNNTDVGTFLFQAQTFADGKLLRTTPEPREFFQQWQAIVRDQSYAYYAPGHALFLALPMALKLDPWMTPWLMSGCSILLMAAWTRRVFGTETAILATCMLALSPFFGANGASLLSHSSTLALTLLFLWSITKWAQEECSISALLSGLCLAWIFATRPVNAVALGTAWIPWVLWKRGMRWQNRLAWTLFFTGTSIIIAALLFYYRALCGRWTTHLFTDYWPRNKFGFGTDLGRGEPGHFFQTYANHDFHGMLANWKYSLEALALWWSGNTWVSLLLLVIAGLLVFFRSSSPRFTMHPSRDNGMTPSSSSLSLCIPFIFWMLLHIFLYSLYYTPSTGFSGPRYLTEILPALAGLTSLLFLSAARSRPAIAVLLLMIFAGSTAWFKSGFYASHAKGSKMKRQVEQTVWTGAQPPALIFLRSFWIGHPYPIFLNSSCMNHPILFACDRGEENRRLVERYPGRNAYILSVTPGLKGSVQSELILIYEASTHHWIRDPGRVSAPFFIGGRFTPSLELRDETARRLFHPKPEEIVGQ